VGGLWEKKKNYYACIHIYIYVYYIYSHRMYRFRSAFWDSNWWCPPPGRARSWTRQVHA
jgi:hypothetical protein